MADYWKERFAKSQDKLSQKNIKQVEKQLKKSAIVNYLTEMTMQGLVFDKDFLFPDLH